MKALLLSAIALGLMQLSNAASAAALRFESSAKQVSLVELYTSEGCSSCPAAEAWLSGLRESGGLWKEFVPVAFHVDYWDYLGWRDPWSASQFTRRQRAYARAWSSRTIYTPGFVLNGKEWRRWSQQKTVPGAAGTDPGQLVLSSADTNHWHVSFAPAAALKGGCQFHAALLASGLSSEVTAGENNGRRLVHDFVVLTLSEGSLSAKGPSFEGDFVLNSKPKASQGRLALAVWVGPVDQPGPLQAAGGWLGPATGP